jgi:gluconate 5-dehydrogenase
MGHETGHLEELFGLEGKVAMVTGASSGLGQEAARALAKAGANVGLVARRADRLEQFARELAKLGVRTCVAPADVTEDEQVIAAIDRIEADLGPVEILVNGAGIAPMSRAEKHARAKWDAALAVNLTAAFVTTQAVGRRMIEREIPGRIINISSVMGSHANPVHRAIGYVVSKSGLDGLTRQFAIEWAPYSITVNALAPGYFPTEMTIDPRHGDVAPDQKEVMEQFTPLRRLGRPGELETAILFLAAPASTYVSGMVLPVDGGWSAW